MRIFTIIILLGISAGAFSQYYPREIGLRGGYSGGFTFRANIEHNLSYEAQLCYRNHGAVFTMYRLKHKELGMDKYGNWELVYGTGVHAGFYFTDSYRVFYQQINYGQNLFTPVMGVDGFIGIEYMMEYFPVTFGCSFQPHAEVSLRQIFSVNLWDFGVHARYRF
jgi:hypothetical protein